MKKNIQKAILNFFLSGFVFGLLMYLSDPEKNIKHALFQGVFFGLAMGLFDVFVKPRIDNYYSKKNKKQQEP